MIGLQRKLFEDSEIELFDKLKEKRTEVEESIKRCNEKRDLIISKLEEIQDDNNSPKNIRDYINKTESVLESIDAIIKNYTLIENKYHSIDKHYVVLSEKSKLNLEDDLEKDVEIIKDKIAELKKIENQIIEENEKYNLLIDNFLNDEKNIRNAVVIENIANDISELKDNLILRVSEYEEKVFLPYTKLEIEKFMERYPKDYKTYQDVIDQEFTAHISIYNKHPVFARFREAYSLSRNKEMKSAIDSLKFAMDIMFRSDLNPTIIAAVKSQKQLEDYIECLENEDLENFKYFKIVFEVSPI